MTTDVAAALRVDASWISIALASLPARQRLAARALQRRTALSWLVTIRPPVSTAAASVAAGGARGAAVVAAPPASLVAALATTFQAMATAANMSESTGFTVMALSEAFNSAKPTLTPPPAAATAAGAGGATATSSIAGIAGGAAGGILAIASAAAIFVIIRRRRARRQQNEGDAAIEPEIFVHAAGEKMALPDTDAVAADAAAATDAATAVIASGDAAVEPKVFVHAGENVAMPPDTDASVDVAAAADAATAVVAAATLDASSGASAHAAPEPDPTPEHDPAASASGPAVPPGVAFAAPSATSTTHVLAAGLFHPRSWATAAQQKPSSPTGSVGGGTTGLHVRALASWWNDMAAMPGLALTLAKAGLGADRAHAVLLDIAPVREPSVVAALLIARAAATGGGSVALTAAEVGAVLFALGITDAALVADTCRSADVPPELTRAITQALIDVALRATANEP